MTQQWRDISDAPRDGTAIEIQNNWGVAPHYAVCVWTDGGWRHADDPKRGMSDGAHLSWRPYEGVINEYHDPTGGAQDTFAYWQMACGRPDLAAASGDRRLDEPVRKKRDPNGIMAFALAAFVYLLIILIIVSTFL